MTDRMEKIIAAGEADHEAVRLEERAKIVAWLRAEAQTCDCYAHEAGECACGAWDSEPGERTYKRGYVEDYADAIERGEHLGDPA